MLSGRTTSGSVATPIPIPTPAATVADTTFTVEGLSVHFDAVKAVDGVDLTAVGGEILGLIGPNGAGKTTLLNAVSGYVRPTAGRVLLDGRDVVGLAPERLVERGIGRTFQGARVFPALTVAENVEVGALGRGVRRPAARIEARRLLAGLGLAARAELRAGALPHGEQRLLGIARALATEPRVLLLDEPAAGLDEAESDRLVEILRDLRDRLRLAIVLIEHDMRLVMAACDRLHVLDHGRTIAGGDVDAVRHDPQVLRAYLGTEADDVVDGA